MVEARRIPLSKKRQIAIFQRDGWLCCWCKRPVIFAPVMKLLAMEVKATGDANLAYYHAHWTRDGAPLLDELGAVLDHIHAHSIGGFANEENLITACNKCNGRKSAKALDNWNRRQKRTAVKGKYGEPQHWDGLTALFEVLAQRYATLLSAGEKEWLAAIKSVREITLATQ